MKRKSLAAAIISLIFLLFYFVDEISLSSILRKSSTTATTIQAYRNWKGARHHAMSANEPTGSPLADERSNPKQHGELKTRTSWAPSDSLSDEKAENWPISCDRSDYRYDICSLNGPTVLDPTSSTLIVSASDLSHPTDRPTQQKVRPYPRKWEKDVMSRIREVTLTLTSAPATVPPCKIRHSTPALVFNAGGYTGNLFHDFNEGFIPLFVTTHSISSNRDLILVIANSRDWWLSKYAELLLQFSRHRIVNLDNDTDTHCFPSATVGLISHGFMTVEPKLLPHSETLLDFRSLIGVAYRDIPDYFRPLTGRPRLVLVARSGGIGRVMVNQVEVVKAAEVVGFEVVVFEPTRYTSLSQAYGLINGSHAMLGVHGAALTHLLFLRPGSVFMQVVPIGTDWPAEICYGKPAMDMGLEYMEYKTKVEESSLAGRYGKDDLVLKDPKAAVKEEWSNTKNIYLKSQDVMLDLDRMGRYLNKAYEKAKRFMEKDG